MKKIKNYIPWFFSILGRMNKNCHSSCQMKIAFYSISIFVMLISGAGCKKLVEVPPPNTVVTETSVFQNDQTAIAAVTNLYATFSIYGFGNFETNSISYYSALSADELTLYDLSLSPGSTAYYTNSLSATGIATGSDMWVSFYQQVFMANASIEGISNSTKLTPAIKQQLLGEAKFLRAFYYFYLTNLYGDVPLILSTDYKVNANASRTPSTKVYDQIVMDLTDAQNLLNSDFLDGSLLKPTSERVRPTKWAASALLARVYLYRKDWANAALQSSAVINNSGQFSLTSMSDVFLKNSNEAIWQIQPVFYGINTNDAITFVIPSTGFSSQNPVYLSQDLLNAFEPGDQRVNNWVGTINLDGTNYSYPYKYKINTVNAPVQEYTMVFRLAEQYLIRAEAEANGANGGVNNALGDLDVIRTRAGLPNYSGPVDEASVLAAIAHERQVELFTEWGHRWLDLKRTGTIDAVMSIATPQKGGSWHSTQQLYPVPISDIQKDPNLSQNPGY